jgi:hypothetical protein
MNLEAVKEGYTLNNTGLAKYLKTVALKQHRDLIEG